MQARGTAQLTRRGIGFELALALPRPAAPRPAARDEVPYAGAYPRQRAWSRRMIAAGRCSRCGDLRTDFARHCNACHAKMGGRAKGEHRRQLAPAAVLAIREAHAAGTPMRRLAQAHGTSGANVALIVYGMTWRHVGGPIADPPEARRGLRAGPIRSIVFGG